MDVHFSFRGWLRPLLVAGGVVLLLGGLFQPASAQWQLASPDGDSSIKFGFLLQGRAETQKTESVDGMNQNIYFRRARILIGGKVNDRVGFFLETDSPNMGTVSSGSKQFGNTYIQDWVVTYRLAKGHNLDGGLILTPSEYNHLQSAISLLAMDYGRYSFIESGPIGANIGRDVGLQARGLLVQNQVEYRVGVFQGQRTGQTEPFRVVARAAYCPWGAPTGLFYSGTYMGKKQWLSIGAAVDRQKDFASYHGDVFYEQPTGPGQCVTVQFDYSVYDGGDYITAIPKQSIWLAEVGYGLVNNRFVPYIQASGRNYDGTTGSNERYIQGGLTWRVDGHKTNVKLGWTHTDTDEHPITKAPNPKKDLLQLQFQVSAF